MNSSKFKINKVIGINSQALHILEIKIPEEVDARIINNFFYGHLCPFALIRYSTSSDGIIIPVNKQQVH